MRLWIGFTVKAETASGRVWELNGVFDDEDKARAACVEWEDGYFPMELNAVAPRETTTMPDVRWPVAEASNGGSAS